MLRTSALIVVFTILAPAASGRGQSSAGPTTIGDLRKICDVYSNLELVFVGRAEPPVTFRISGEGEIEKARQNLLRTETEVARLRDSLDSGTRAEREVEFVRRIVLADAELARRRVMYPPPYNLTFVPISVEQAFRGVTEPRLMLLADPVRQADPPIRMEAGELYFITGHRSKTLLQPWLIFPEMSNLVDLGEYVDTTRVTPVALAQPDVQFLAATASGATIIGMLRMHSYGDAAGDPLAAVRMAVSSGTHVVETVTGADGSFVVTGIEAGRLQIRPFLREDLTVVNRSALALQVAAGGCKTVHLTAALNGRLRGRIVTSTANSLGAIELVLQGMDSSGHVGGSHYPLTTVRPNNDGTFEFFGQSPGSYVLSARFVKVEDGKERYLITYFPGTPDLAAAVPILIGRATQQDGFDFPVTTE